MWNDFTTYFNLYYNAETLFEETEQRILDYREDLFAFKEMPYRPVDATDLNKVIEKCSKILQFNSESGYFDDALLMAGKSFYYIENYAKALRKFLELSSLDESGLRLETKMWIGKTQFQLRDFEAALQTLDEVKTQALDEEEEDIYIEAFISEIRYLMYKENFDAAVNACENLLENSSDDNLNAEIAYEMGKIYLELNDLEKAAYAFERVADYSPTFEVEFQSKLELARLFYNLESTDKGIQVLEDLKKQDKFEDFWDQVDIEMGIIFYGMGEIDLAFDKFMHVDSTYANNISGGIASYHLANIYEKDYKDYREAAAYFRAANQSRAPQEIKDEVSIKTEYYNKYEDIHYALYGYLKQRTYINDSDIFYDDSLEYADYLALKMLEQNQNKPGSTTTSTTTTTGTSTSTQSDTRTGGATTTGRTTQAQSGSSGNVKNAASRHEKFYRKKDRFKPTISKLSYDSLNVLIAKNRVELGNLFISDLEIPDSAYYYYTQTLNELPNSIYTPRVIYSLGAYYSMINDKETADSLFTIVYKNYPDEEVHEEAARKLGLFEEKVDQDPAGDLYLLAEEKFFNNDFDSAIKAFYNIADSSSESQFAPKSLYTVGWILENELQLNDSAAAVYSRLIRDYDVSEYATAVKSKISFYEASLVDTTADSTSTGVTDVLIGDQSVKEEKPEEKIIQPVEAEKPEAAKSRRSRASYKTR